MELNGPGGPFHSQMMPTFVYVHMHVRKCHGEISGGRDCCGKLRRKSGLSGFTWWYHHFSGDQPGHTIAFVGDQRLGTLDSKRCLSRVESINIQLILWNAIILEWLGEHSALWRVGRQYLSLCSKAVESVSAGNVMSESENEYRGRQKHDNAKCAPKRLEILA